MIRIIRNLLLLLAFGIIAVLGVGLYRQYLAPQAPVPAAGNETPGQQATASDPAQDAAPRAGSGEMATPASQTQDGGAAQDGAVVVDVPQESGAEFFALSVKLIDQGVVEIKSRREEAGDIHYFVHLVTCTTLRTGVVAQSPDLAGLAELNETPVMQVPTDGSAELMLSQIACASVEN